MVASGVLGRLRAAGDTPGAGAAASEHMFLVGTAGPGRCPQSPGVSDLGGIGAGVLAMQHEGHPGFLHFLLEEMLLGNPDHLCQLPEEDEGF